MRSDAESPQGFFLKSLLKSYASKYKRYLTAYAGMKLYLMQAYFNILNALFLTAAVINN